MKKIANSVKFEGYAARYKEDDGSFSISSEPLLVVFYENGENEIYIFDSEVCEFYPCSRFDSFMGVVKKDLKA